MESNYKSYDFDKSIERIDEILNSSDNNYEEKDTIPSRNNLTFTNGYYVNCTAIFVDICDSSDLPNQHRRPVLAKIYRSFISEMVALFNGCPLCKEVNIHGDCVWGIFDTTTKSDIVTCFCLAAKAHSLIKAINKRLASKKYSTYSVGIGIDYGRALMIKAGYKGSTINDVVWMGDVVNQACHLASHGNQSVGDYTIMLSQIIYDNIDDEECQKYIDWNNSYNCYHSSAVWKDMENHQ